MKNIDIILPLTKAERETVLHALWELSNYIPESGNETAKQRKLREACAGLHDKIKKFPRLK